MPVDPDNSPMGLPHALHAPFLPGWAEALLIGAFGVVVVAAVWGKRIAGAASTLYSFTKGVITRNADLESRIAHLEKSSDAKLAQLQNLADRVQEILNAVAPPGARSYRDMLAELLRNEAIATARLRALTETDSAARFECDANGMCIHVNDALCHLFNLSRERMLKNGWLEAIPAEQRAGVYEAWQNAVTNELPYAHEYDVITPMGRTRVYAKTISVPYNGQTELYLGTVTPVKHPLFPPTPTSPPPPP